MAKPEKQFRVGNVSASVFANTIDTARGKRTVRNVNLQRRYYDEQEPNPEKKWKSISSFGLGDLPQAIRVLTIAQEHMESLEADVTD